VTETEVFYTYVKGQGWVPLTVESVILHTTDGKCFRMEARVPNIGEQWSCGWNGEWILTPKVPNMKAFTKLFTPTPSQISRPFTKADFDHYENLGEGRTAWVTFVTL
jgi:hypothetical protein